MTKQNLYIYSGKSNLGQVGKPVGANDASDKPLHVGDIVQLWYGRWIGTDLECWAPENGLTAIVSDEFISYSDGTLERKEGEPKFFCMGIKGCGFNSPEWQIHIVKSHKDVINGERWAAYGFNYLYSSIADEILSNEAI